MNNTFTKHPDYDQWTLDRDATLVILCNRHPQGDWYCVTHYGIRLDSYRTLRGAKRNAVNIANEGVALAQAQR